MGLPSSTKFNANIKAHENHGKVELEVFNVRQRTGLFGNIQIAAIIKKMSWPASDQLIYFCTIILCRVSPSYTIDKFSSATFNISK